MGMKLRLKYNKRISDVFNQKVWDIYGVYPDGQEEYIRRWLVELSDGNFSMAYNELGKTIMCDPQPTKELALEYYLALAVAERLEGRGNIKYFQATWTETKDDQ
jgi:hypothetical protein